jgi:hypothetical protein
MSSCDTGINRMQRHTPSYVIKYFIAAFTRKSIMERVRA